MRLSPQNLVSFVADKMFAFTFVLIEKTEAPVKKRYMLSVKEIEQQDMEAIINYWLEADKQSLEAMGADNTKIPAREEWIEMLTEQISEPVQQKKSYCIIWRINNEAIGHSNINKIKFAEEAYMHLHLWKKDIRIKGYGTAFVKLTLPYYFTNFNLKKLYCEPYALNPAPNKTLKKIGFELIKQYRTTPGFINFEQDVNLWQLTREQYLKLPEADLLQ